MPKPIRPSQEKEIAAALVLLFEDWENRDWNREEFKEELRLALTGKLGEIYQEAASKFIEQHNLDISQQVVEVNALRWATVYAMMLAGEIAQTTEKAMEAGLPPFTPERADMITTTETTRAMQGGKRAVVEDRKRQNQEQWEGYWITHPEKSLSGVCPVCKPLNGTPESEWSKVAYDGPPVHPHCVCEVRYERIA